MLHASTKLMVQILQNKVAVIVNAVVLNIKLVERIMKVVVSSILFSEHPGHALCQ